jgi:hypothetical protein
MIVNGLQILGEETVDMASTTSGRLRDSRLQQMLFWNSVDESWPAKLHTALATWFASASE